MEVLYILLGGIALMLFSWWLFGGPIRPEGIVGMDWEAEQHSDEE